MRRKIIPIILVATLLWTIGNTVAIVIIDEDNTKTFWSHQGQLWKVPRLWDGRKSDNEYFEIRLKLIQEQLDLLYEMAQRRKIK